MPFHVIMLSKALTVCSNVIAFIPRVTHVIIYTICEVIFKLNHVSVFNYS